MSHPFWLINSSLVVLCTIASFFVYYTGITLPDREDLEPVLYSKPKSEHHLAVNIKHIYEQDLFGTYRKELPRHEQPAVVAPLLPEPPQPQRLVVPEPPKPSFLDPLNITLKGISVISSDETKNSAIISDNKTDQESTYKVGDNILDAQIIRIFGNKIILLRPNGQQEVLYLREQDANADPAYARIENWQGVITQKSRTTFSIQPHAFAKRIENLPRLIELLGLTTAYQKGLPVGTRIGNQPHSSLSTFLGLYPGDIVISINSIPATTTENRFTIYQEVISSNSGAKIQVALLRGGRNIEQTYIIEAFEEEKITVPKRKNTEPETAAALAQPEEEIDFNVESPSEDFDTDLFSFTTQQLRKQEAANMLAHGKKPESINLADYAGKR